jgi:hypothetical protein
MLDDFVAQARTPELVISKDTADGGCATIQTRPLNGTLQTPPLSPYRAAAAGRVRDMREFGGYDSACPWYNAMHGSNLFVPSWTQKRAGRSGAPLHRVTPA